MNRYWLYVLIAGIFEVVWVAGLKYSDTFLQWGATIIVMLISFSVFIQATNHLPIGTVYAVFTGLGTAGTVLTELVLFNEPVNIYKLLLIGTLLLGVIGLKTLTPTISESAKERGVE